MEDGDLPVSPLTSWPLMMRTVRPAHEWEDAYIDGLDLLGVKIEDRTTPFDGATGVTHPILSEAVIRFVSQAMMEIFPRTALSAPQSSEKILWRRMNRHAVCKTT